MLRNSLLPTSLLNVIHTTTPARRSYCHTIQYHPLSAVYCAKQKRYFASTASTQSPFSIALKPTLSLSRSNTPTSPSPSTDTMTNYLIPATHKRFYEAIHEHCTDNNNHAIVAGSTALACLYNKIHHRPPSWPPNDIDIFTDELNLSDHLPSIFETFQNDPSLSPIITKTRIINPKSEPYCAYQRFYTIKEIINVRLVRPDAPHSPHANKPHRISSSDDSSLQPPIQIIIVKPAQSSAQMSFPASVLLSFDLSIVRVAIEGSIDEHAYITPDAETITDITNYEMHYNIMEHASHKILSLPARVIKYIDRGFRLVGFNFPQAQMTFPSGCYLHPTSEPTNASQNQRRVRARPQLLSDKSRFSSVATLTASPTSSSQHSTATNSSSRQSIEKVSLRKKTTTPVPVFLLHPNYFLNNYVIQDDTLSFTFVLI